MNLMFKAICQLGLTYILTSCAGVYSPQMRYTPLFKKAGEVQGAAQLQQPLEIGSGPDSNGDRIDFNAQGAIAVTNHFGLMGNYAYARVNRGTLLGHYDYDHNYYESTVGYYTNSKSFTYEIYVGYGQGDGKTNVYDEKYSHTSQGKYVRYILQPSIGFTLKSFQFAFTPRVSLISFSDVIGDNEPVTDGISNKASFEPAVTARFNFLHNMLFGMGQLGFGVSNLMGNSYPSHLYNPISISFGVGFRLWGKGWKKDE